MDTCRAHGECGDETSASIKCVEFPDSLTSCQILQNDSILQLAYLKVTTFLEKDGHRSCWTVWAAWDRAPRDFVYFGRNLTFCRNVRPLHGTLKMPATFLSPIHPQNIRMSINSNRLQCTITENCRDIMGVYCMNHVHDIAVWARWKGLQCKSKPLHHEQSNEPDLFNSRCDSHPTPHTPLRIARKVCKPLTKARHSRTATKCPHKPHVPARWQRIITTAHCSTVSHYTSFSLCTREQSSAFL